MSDTNTVTGGLGFGLGRRPLASRGGFERVSASLTQPLAYLTPALRPAGARKLRHKSGAVRKGDTDMC